MPTVIYLSSGTQLYVQEEPAEVSDGLAAGGVAQLTEDDDQAEVVYVNSAAVTHWHATKGGGPHMETFE